MSEKDIVIHNKEVGVWLSTNEYTDLHRQLADCRKELAEAKEYTKTFHAQQGLLKDVIADKDKEIERLNSHNCKDMTLYPIRTNP